MTVLLIKVIALLSVVIISLISWVGIRLINKIDSLAEKTMQAHMEFNSRIVQVETEVVFLRNNHDKGLTGFANH